MRRPAELSKRRHICRENKHILLVFARLLVQIRSDVGVRQGWIVLCLASEEGHRFTAVETQ